MSVANESEPLPLFLSHLRVPAIEGEPPRSALDAEHRETDDTVGGLAGNLHRRDAEVEHATRGRRETEIHGWDGFD
jgi:hypothetical protein